ncbi:stalk domain-containing protein [Paenibacillus methanolicus]|uniref:Copper amine oxidase-like protein n=1 Tax=Paenibacillus methanolicus TaxID=582686 RepID=A0A5S5BRM4_9BACL|nr:stalk domain-containing protein [Paenibacillus methanolicus]TYP68946.1 copper amine oxidase-like protein [Paenibacillus methanolicus]
MKLKQIGSAAALALLCVTGAFPAYAAEQTNALRIDYANGEKRVLERSDYATRDNRLYVSPHLLSLLVPFDTVSKGIAWNADEQRLLIQAFDLNAVGERSDGFTMIAGEKAFYDHVLDQRFEITQEMLLTEGRVYLPLRAIAEAYGYSVEYDADGGESVIRIAGGAAQ